MTGSLTTDFAPRLDPHGPLPLYHQIAVAVRYRIATGRLAPGASLPTLREAARRWGVNYHTVRKAYRIIEEAGLIESRQGSGTRVTSGSAVVRELERSALDRFLREVSETARDRFGLEPDQLSTLLGRRANADPESSKREGRAVTVVECNSHQCADLADQLRSAYELDVGELVLGDADSPPEGALIGTFFHLTEMHRRWPERIRDMHFPAIEPNPFLRDRLAEWSRGDETVDIPLCEREATLAEAMADDVTNLLLPAGFRVTPVVDRDVEQVLADAAGRPVLIAPRLWNDLPPPIRRRREAVDVAYRFRPSDIDALAEHLGWGVRRPFRRPPGHR